MGAAAGRPAEGGAGSGGDAGRGGTAGHRAGGDSGRGGSTGGTGPSVPGASEREQEILAPLATDDATLDAVSGTDLTELASDIGMARGYAMCRCFRSPMSPPDDVESLLEECAREESGTRYLAFPNQRRCVEEGLSDVAGLQDYIRCEAKLFRNDGVSWTKQCVEPDVEYVPPAGGCTQQPEVATFLEECSFIHYCPDGTRVMGARCNQRFECSDQSDELGCYVERGHDWFWCDGELMDAYEACSSFGCGPAKQPSVCVPDHPELYLCNDGAEISIYSVCDRVLDCTDGSDERYCVK